MLVFNLDLHLLTIKPTLPPNCQTSASPLSGREHNYQLLATVEKELSSRFADNIKKMSEKQNELCGIERLSWQRMDDLSDKGRKMMEEVDRVTGEQVRGNIANRLTDNWTFGPHFERFTLHF